MFESSLLEFFANFYAEERKLQNGNYRNTCFSPLSLYTALSMTLLGSEGATKDEVSQCLKLKEESGNSNVHIVIGNAIQEIVQSAKATDLLFKNRMFFYEKLEVSSDFKSRLEKIYRVESEEMDFERESEKSRQLMNQWFKDGTSGKIAELFPSGSITSDTRLILGNALYFKGLWQMPFDKKSTREGDFSVLGGSKLKVQMMNRVGMVPYLDTLPMDGKAVKLKFKDEKWELLIMLPPSNDDFEEFVKLVTTGNQLKQILEEEFIEQSVQLCIPRFKLSMPSGLEVKKLLQGMGVTTLFRNANLSKISSEPLFVSDILHQSVLEVNEEGAEAAATTGVHMMNRCMIRPERFLVDHAFLVAVIVDKRVPVFFGQVISPEC